MFDRVLNTPLIYIFKDIWIINGCFLSIFFFYWNREKNQNNILYDGIITRFFFFFTTNFTANNIKGLLFLLKWFHLRTDYNLITTLSSINRFHWFFCNLLENKLFFLLTFWTSVIPNNPTNKSCSSKWFFLAG